MPIRDPSWRRRFRTGAIVAVLIGYPVAAHYVAAAPPTAHLGVVAFAVAPLLAALALVGWQQRLRVATLVLCVAAGFAIWRYSGLIGHNLGLVYFIQATCANAALALIFGRSLADGREPLCTRLARMLRGTLEPRVEHYTRQITLAWTLFFVALLVVSSLLYALAPIAVWSMFSNLMTMPLIALMFVVEYAIRVRRFPHMAHKPILAVLRAYWNSPRATTPPR